MSRFSILDIFHAHNIHIYLFWVITIQLILKDDLNILIILSSCVLIGLYLPVCPPVFLKKSVYTKIHQVITQVPNNSENLCLKKSSDVHIFVGDFLRHIFFFFYYRP